MNEPVPDTIDPSPRPASVKVWDIFIRFFHWAIVVGFFVAYFTEDDVLTLHVWAGYTVGALVVLRVLWGLVGPKHARFTDFIYRPSVVRRYLADLLTFRARRYLGHSPAGGAMVIALLLGLFGTVWSGMELYAVEKNAGPLAGAPSWNSPATTPAVSLLLMASETERSDREGGEEHEDSVWEEIHEILAQAVLILVILHVIGVGWASMAHRENLVRSMITGLKRKLD